ncbi:MAG: hypothetical protein H6765_10670 [Candidatus Peribacteria bacterium]|nr:MAG: hypothetical protein H6765_10670 [Candidatus Peribacteria bacterium]
MCVVANDLPTPNSCKKTVTIEDTDNPGYCNVSVIDNACIEESVSFIVTASNGGHNSTLTYTLEGENYTVDSGVVEMDGNVTFVTAFGYPSTYTLHASVYNQMLGETYVCNGTIVVDDSCIEEPYCGNGIKEPGEECEPNNYG